MPLECKIIKEKEALKGILPEIKEGEPYVRTLRANGIMGSQHNLVWYRGKHAGWIEAIIILQKLKMPKAAQKLQEYFRLNDDGNIECR